MASSADFRQTVFAAEQAGVLPAFLTQHFSTQGGTFGLFAEIVLSLLSSDQDAMVRRLHAALPDNFALRYVTHYAAGCLAAKANDIFATYRELCQAVRVGAAAQGLFANDDVATNLWYGALQQAFAIDPEHPALALSPEGLPCPDAASSTPVIFASCNGDYFERFGPEFLASAAPLSGLRCHIHVVNPTSSTQPLFAQATAHAAATFSLAIDTGPTDASFYACKRFLLAGDVMDRFAADIIVTDIDTVVKPALLDLPQIAGDVDGAMFERGGKTAPMEICHCSLTLFRHTATARRLLQLLPIYLAPKLEENGVWMLDQCSLFTLTRLAAREETRHLWHGVPALRWENLSIIAGLSLEALNPNQSTAHDVSEKRAMRGYQTMGELELRISAEGRPAFSRGAAVAAAE
jgi:hypothetical protein